MSGMLAEDASLSSPELAGLLSLLVHERLVACSILQHLRRILVAPLVKLLFVVLLQVCDLLFGILLELSLPGFELVELILYLQLAARKLLVEFSNLFLLFVGA